MSATGTDTATLEAFLADKCEATKAKYAAELEHASHAWRKPLEWRYAESLVYFGLLERMTRPVRRGSRSWFRKSQKTTHTVEFSCPPVNQREEIAA